ncbi:MAG: hypothetical protein PHV16_00915 [Candidatus Nanoarchaeia archaeon]|nr:hypothetical protein [Candidatus Nanoarchaeia archaeon]
MKKEKKGGPSLVKYIIFFFIVFFITLYFVFQPKDIHSTTIPFIISLSLSYLFAIWLFSQNE